ncbi:hypothetical protein BC835DRAFT_1522787 [Cytidiella melzeri]|nr:hypothetical protein BC835DRAFT_1522787 [Cytidiella melzeri]
MQVIFNVLTLATLLASFNAAFAAPHKLSRRSDGTLTACDTWDFAGTCENIDFVHDQCQDIPTELQDVISSMNVTPGSSCQAFINFGCNSNQGQITVQSPGIAEMQLGNDAISSFLCTAN